MSRCIAQHHRSGAALIIAIVVLAALLMLGLPFLFTQSGSLSGTRSYAHSELANIGQDSAQSMGVAAGSSAVSYHWQQGGVTNGSQVILDDWTDLFWSLGGQQPQSGLRKVSGFVNRVEFDTRNHTFALPGGNFLSGMDSDDRDIQLRRYPIVVGLTIEDESGKLNPNYLDAVAWGRLLFALRINDWENDFSEETSISWDPSSNQLARALAALRYQLAGGRITSLDQLLRAEPSAQPSTRRGLTRSELELLRPYLSLSVPSQARGGMIDLGTVIGSSDSDKKISIDSTQPVGLIAFPITPLVIGVGTTVLAEDNTGVIHALPVTGDDEAVVPKIGNPLAIDAPPLVNLHQAEAPVREVLTKVPPANLPLPEDANATPPIPKNAPPTPAVITGLDTYNSTKPVDALLRTRSWFELTSPLSIPETLGSADVVDALNGASTPVSELAPDAAGVLRKVLLASSTLLVISGDSLDHFPNQGYALLRGEFAAGTLPFPNDKPEEFIFYDARGALPQNVSAARMNSTVQVHVTRFRDPVTPPPGKAAQAFKIENLKFIAIAPREQHPIGIASQGVITIASAATVTDPAGNQTAQQQHRVIAQALPQEAQLEARWNKQAAFHALLAQRHGSLMTTFPQPYPRITDLMPDDPANNVPSAPVPTDLDEMAGIRPAVMRTLLSSSHLNHGWTLPVSGTSAQALAGNSAYTSADVTPEGLRLDASRVLSYPNDSSVGLIPDSYNPSTKQLVQINGRQFGLWVRPDATWTGQVALLDMRIPSGNLGESLTGVLQPEQSSDKRLPVTSSDVCNRFTLVYDAVLKQVILTLNPGNIPHTADYGPKIPRETYGPTTGVPLVDNIWPAVNPECLGSGGSSPMASASPATSIQHRYALGPAFIPETWHLIQVAFSSNLPGGMSIIVDGLVGRDVTLLGSTATPAIPAAMTLPGDHLTLPSLVLREELLATPSVSTNGTGALYQDKIQLDACAQVGGAMVTGGLAVKALLPERGMVRIGNEYISYQSIDANGVLMDCVRARRQRTDAQLSYNAMNQPVIDWDKAHKLEAHAVGTQVLPGGFAIRELSRPWWRGGCSLAQIMPDGDPIHQYQVHAAVTTKLPITLIPAGSSSLTLSGSYLVDFPMRGYVMVNNSQLFYYDNVDKLPSDAEELTHVSYWVRSLVVPDPKDPSKTIITDEWRSGISADIPAGSTVVLVSVELKGDPTTDLAYISVRNNGSNPWTSQSADAPVMVQLYDARSAESAPNGGRAEWLTYSSIDSRTTYLTSVGTRVSFLLNITSETKEVEIIPSTNPKTYYSVTSYRPGFWFDSNDRSGARGRERTAFAKTDLKTYSPADHRFPTGTRVIPVQTNFANAQLLEAGDMVTLAPVVMGTAVSGQRPLQMCVRYSAHEGFPETTTSTSWPWHVTSGNFAFTEAIPDTWNPNNSNFHLLCWPCWTPEIDLSAIQTNTWQAHRQGWVLPWGNAYAPDFDPVLRKGEITFLTDANSAAGKAGMIDAIHAGIQPGWQQGGQVQTHILPSSDAIWLDDQPLRERTVVVANYGIFTDLYGIVEIGGETFAYKQWDNQSVPFVQSTTQAWLISRSLLGSRARIHKGPELILRLPIGPVTEVIGSVPPPPPVTDPPTETSPPEPMGTDFTGPLDLVSLPGRSFNPPAVLLTSRDGKSQEITMLPNNHTAPWLRGMYNTIPIEWEVRPPVPAIAPPPTDGSPPPPLPRIPNLAPLAIGWWPRYPSGYPQKTPEDSHIANELKIEQRLLANKVPPQFLSADQLTFLKTHAARMRCRSYAWAGFPLRFHDVQFKKLDVPEVTILSDGGIFDLYAVALDGTMDWNVAGDFSKPDDLTEIFASDRFMILEDEKLNTRLINPQDNIRLINGVPQPRKDNTRTVDGAELRIIWDYYDDPLPATASPAEWLQKTARNGNSAPMIGPVYLRARAPNKIISVER